MIQSTSDVALRSKKTLTLRDIFLVVTLVATVAATRHAEHDRQRKVALVGAILGARNPDLSEYAGDYINIYLEYSPYGLKAFRFSLPKGREYDLCFSAIGKAEAVPSDLSKQIRLAPGEHHVAYRNRSINRIELCVDHSVHWIENVVDGGSRTIHSDVRSAYVKSMPPDKRIVLVREETNQGNFRESLWIEPVAQ